MDIFKIDQTSIDAIAYKAAKIVVSELKKCEEPQLEMVPVSENTRNIRRSHAAY